MSQLLKIMNKYFEKAKKYYLPELTEIFAKSRNAEQLKHAWVEWRKASGNKYRKEYLEFIGINTEAATSLGEFLPFHIVQARPCSKAVSS